MPTIHQHKQNTELRNVEGKMRNEKCGTTVIGPQVRPRTAGITQITARRASPVQR